MAKKKEVKKKVEVKSNAATVTPLARIMFEHNISSDFLKNETGLGANVISKLKNGHKKNPYASTLNIIAIALTKITGQKYKIEDLL